MDKRHYKGVVLVTGLLLLIVLVNILLLSITSKEIRRYEEYTYGSLLAAHPELELELIELSGKDYGKEYEFNNKVYTEVKTIGEDFLDKYGYSKGGTYITKQLDKHMSIWIVLMVLLSAAAILFAIYKRKKAAYESGYEINEISAFLQTIYNNQEYKFMNLKKEPESYQRLKGQLKEVKIYYYNLKESLKREEIETKSLITDISHQLRTPAASLKMSFEIADSDSFTEEERKAFLRQGRTDVTNLEALLEAMINLSRLETGMIQIHPIPGGIKKTLQNAVSSVYMKAFQKNIDISMQEFEDIVIMHDSKWTKEAVANVLENAIKYSEPDTSIDIRIEILTTYILIEIADEGIGIPAKEYPNIYKRFYRIQGHKDKADGTGVGLYLTRRIIEEESGSISVRPNRNKGSIFQITLPK